MGLLIYKRLFLNSHALGIALSKFGYPVLIFVNFAVLSRGIDSFSAGKFFYLYSLALVFSVVADFGQRQILYARIAASREALKPIIVEQLRLKLILLPIAIAGYVFVAWVQLGDDFELLSTLLMAPFLGLVPVADTFLQALKGTKRGGAEATLLLAEQSLIGISFLALFLSSSFSLNLAIGVLVFFAMVRSALAGKLVAANMGKKRDDYIPATVGYLLRSSSGTFVALLLILALVRFPIFLLTGAGELHSVAMVTILLMLVQKSELLPNFLLQAVVPQLDKSKMRPSFRLHRQAIIFIAGVVVGSIVFLAFPVISELYGFSTLPSGLELAIPVAAIPFMYLNQIDRYLLLVSGRDRVLILSVATGLLMGISVSFFGFSDVSVLSTLVGFFVAEVCWYLSSRVFGRMI